MKWQPTQAASVLRQTPNSMDIDMSENIDQGSLRTPLQLRPAIFNPSSENWHESSLGAIRGLERLFEQGVSLSDPTLRQTSSGHNEPVDQCNGKMTTVYAGIGAALATMVAMYLRWAGQI